MDYDISAIDHPGMANVVVDALSCMTMVIVSYLEESNKDLLKYVHRLERLGVYFEDSSNCCFMIRHNSKSSYVVELNSKQHLDKPFM